MNKLLLVIGLMGLSCTPSAAQIHQAGQRTIELSAGLVDGFKLPGKDNFGVFAGLSYSQYRTVNSYWKGTIHLNHKQYAYDKTFVPLSQWLGEATYFTKLMGSLTRSWILNVGGGGAGGYESINQDRREVQGATVMNRSEWIVGPTLAIEGEYVLSSRLLLVARAQEYYLFRSKVTPTRFNLGVGVKFILYNDAEL